MFTTNNPIHKVIFSHTFFHIFPLIRMFTSRHINLSIQTLTEIIIKYGICHTSNVYQRIILIISIISLVKFGRTLELHAPHTTSPKLPFPYTSEGDIEFQVEKIINIWSLPTSPMWPTRSMLILLIRPCREKSY